MPLKFLGQDTGVLPRIDRYELIAELASGGMASVYLARLVGMGGFERFFAIKRLHPHLGHEEAFVSMFLDEARIVAGIRHQHVVPVLEVGASDHGYYLVMEYIEGENLGTFLTQAIETKSPIPPNVVVRILLDVLAGLHAAHEHVDADGHPIGLVHRDVSPQNILIDTNGVARIADFGVAHATSRLSSTRSGQLKGKVAYMAPEQARGEGVSPRSDVFAAAIVLWESLTSRRLFLANNEAVTLNRLLFEPIPELEEVAPSIPRGIARVLARALQRDPAKRYASAADMADELQATARASGWLGSASDVKYYVRNVVGVAMERRRASIREHLSRVSSESSGTANAPGMLERPDIPFSKPSNSSVSSATMAVSTASSITSSSDTHSETPTASRKRSSSLLVAGLGFGLLIVVAVFFALNTNRSLNQGASMPSASTVLPTTSSTASLPITPPSFFSHTISELATTSAQPSASYPTTPIASTRSTRPTSGNGKTTTASHPSASAKSPSEPTTATATPTATSLDDLRQNPYR